MAPLTLGNPDTATLRRVEAVVDHIANQGLQDICDDLDHLRSRAADLEGNRDEDQFSQGRHTFGSYTDLVNWLDQNKIPSFGLFWDLFSVLVVMGPRRHSGKEMADTHYSSQRTNTTNFENDLAAAMTNELPHCLFGKPTGEIGQAKDGFGAIDSFVVWQGAQGNEPYRDLLTRRLEVFLDGLLGASTELPNPALADALINNIRNQFTWLIGFIESFYRELVNVAHFPPKLAWSLVGRCVAAVFKAQQTPQGRVSRLSDFNNIITRGKFAWAVLQCHIVMQKFISLNFQGHPMIVKELSLYMLTERVDPDALKTMQTKVKSVEDSVVQLNQQQAALQGSLATLRRTVDNHSNTLKQKKTLRSGGGQGQGGRDE